LKHRCHCTSCLSKFREWTKNLNKKIVLNTTKNLLSFALALLLGSVLLAGCAYVLQSYLSATFLSEHFLLLCVFLYVVTVVAYAISTLGISVNPEFGVYGILGGMTIKMLVSLSFFIFVLYQFPVENRMAFGLNFFCIYFLMSLFEVIVLLRNL